MPAARNPKETPPKDTLKSPLKSARRSSPRKKTLLHHAQHALLPYKANNHHPHVLKSEIIMAVLSLVLILEVAVLSQGILLFRNSNYLASILPAVVADLTNTQRTDNDLQPLVMSPLLTAAAQDKANDEAAKGYFAHISPDGTLPWYWFKLVGYNYKFAGENLAVNFDDSDSVVNAWMNSPTHRANILKEQYTETGIGMATGMYEGHSTIFVVQFFAQPESGSGSEPDNSNEAAPQVPPANTTTAPPASGSLATNAGTKTKTTEAALPANELMTTTAAPSEVTIATTSSKTLEQEDQQAALAGSTTPTVLGIETNTPSSPWVPVLPTVFQQLLASPFTTANIIFEFIAAFFIAVLIAGIIYRKRLPRMTATIGGLVLVAIVLGFAIANQYFFSNSVKVDTLSTVETSSNAG